MHEGGNLVSVLGWLPGNFNVFGISHKLGPRKRVNELTKAKQSGHWLCFPSGKQMAMQKGALLCWNSGGVLKELQSSDPRA